jgi:hypothetical protein
MTLVLPSLHKTGVYNTLARLGQTGKRRIRIHLPRSGVESVLQRSIGFFSTVAIKGQPCTWYGWRLGHVVDSFGHHWEIGPPLA